jgi:hypothetical protein
MIHTINLYPVASHENIQKKLRLGNFKRINKKIVLFLFLETRLLQLSLNVQTNNDLIMAHK